MYNVCVFLPDNPLESSELLLAEHTTDYDYAALQCCQFAQRYGDLHPEREFAVITIQ